MRDTGKAKEVNPPQEDQGDQSNVYRHYRAYTGKPDAASSEASTSETPFSWGELKRGNQTPESYVESYMADLPDVFHPSTEKALKAALTANFTIRQKVDSFNTMKILAAHAAPDNHRNEMTQILEMASEIENEKRALQERHKSSLESLKGHVENYEILENNVIIMVNKEIEKLFGKKDINDVVKILESNIRKKEENREKISRKERNNLEYFQEKLEVINRNKKLHDSLKALQKDLELQW